MSTLPSPAVEIVPGDITDLDEVMVTMNAAFDPAYGEAWTQAQCSGVMGLAGVWLIVARVGGAAAGFALSRAVMDEAELLLVAVCPNQRRRGVGRELLDAVAGEARTRGASRLHLEMRDGNTARSLYESVGFGEVGRRARYYRGRDGRSFDAITLARSLGPDL